MTSVYDDDDDRYQDNDILMPSLNNKRVAKI